MGNHLALAGVTATIVQLLDEVVSRDLPGANALGGRPDAASATDSPPRVLVFLYRVEPNATWRNEDLPTRTTDGELRRRPQAALTLYYLLTFIGDEAEYEPQRMLGSAAGVLYFHPLLTRAEIEQMVAASVSQDVNHPLAQVDLASQPDLVRITPLDLSLDELSSLWSSFFQVDYRLSVAYRAETVLITPPSTPVTPLPVRERHLALSTVRRPVLRQVNASPDAAAPIFAGSAVTLAGTDLTGDEVTVVRFGESEVASSTATPLRLEATVPSSIAAGAVPVMVEHRRLAGAPRTLRPAGQSNVVPIVVRPRIRRTADTYQVSVTGLGTGPTGGHSGTLKATVDPAVKAGQEVSVLLDPIGGEHGFAFFDDRRKAPGTPAETHDLAIAFSGLPAGDYVVRVVVDGAQSPLDTAASGTYAEPRVSVP
ncbi:DUF4255 domain-containing protein [Streptomyces sp. NPDC059900]|uniref:DUF4255 domain-containing protein n=1 Tax=Streptomyces sp. NPDC059900 TaxID=3155816 RepID=UPI00341734B5